MRDNSVLRDFLRYVSLNILGQMAYSCYTLADTFFVAASLGADGLTALNLAFPMFCLLNGTGLMLGMGGGIRYSILKSCGEHQRANRIFTTGAWMAACFAAVFFLAGLLFSRQIVRALGADDTVFATTNTYLRVMLLFAPAFLANNLLQCFVRNDGSPSRAMAAMMTGSFANIVLDYIFIFPLRMGIFGAIFATSLAPIISMGVLSPYFIGRQNQFHLVWARPRGRDALGIVSSGVPPFVTEVSSGIVMFLFNFIILRLEGNIGVAAFSVITVISLVVVAIYTGLSQGIQPILSTSHGRRETAKVRAILGYAMFTMLLLSAAIYGVVFFGAEQLALVFNSERNQVLQRFAVSGLKLYFLACPFIGFNIVTATYFTSTERPRPAQLISLSRGLFILVPAAFLLSALFQMTGVWCAYPLTECLTAAMGAALYLTAGRRGGEPGRLAGGNR